MITLFIQIPCYNEAETLRETLAALPSEIDGIDTIRILIIDDGSIDNTALIAKEAGVDYVVTHKKNMGLASAFMTGLSMSTFLGADIIVNTDADNQYNAADITKLVQPIIAKKADIVIGARPIAEIEDFSAIKKFLQRFGSWVIRVISKTEVPDAPSGFRAFSRDAALRLNVFSRYTYTLETIIQAGIKNLSITWVPVRVNPKARESRLVKSIPDYLFKSARTALRVFVIYRPLAFFSALGSLAIAAGCMLGLRFLILWFQGLGDGHVQSLILASILIGIGFQTIVTGIQADLIAVNRQLLEKTTGLLHFHILNEQSTMKAADGFPRPADNGSETINYLEHSLWTKR